MFEIAPFDDVLRSDDASCFSALFDPMKTTRFYSSAHEVFLGSSSLLICGFDVEDGGV